MAVVDSCCWSDYGKKVCLRSVDPENLERESGVSVDQERVMCWTRGFWDDKWQMTKSGDGTRGGLIVTPLAAELHVAVAWPTRVHEKLFLFM